MYSVAYLHHGRSQNPAVPPIPGTQFFDNDGLAAVAWLVEHGFMNSRVKWLTGCSDQGQTLTFEYSEELTSKWFRRTVSLADRGIEGIENRKQRLGHSGQSTLDPVVDVARRTFSVVVELGLNPLGRIEIRISLDPQRLDREQQLVENGPIARRLRS